MQYFLTFLEGIISFISPCMLPLLPLYISYFAGNSGTKRNIFMRALSFVFGFTTVFCILGVFAGTVGGLLTHYQSMVNIVCGVMVILFGLSYLDIIPIKLLKGIKGKHRADGILPAFMFGVVYSISLTPCVGAFLGSALMIAATTGTALKGLMLLLLYSMGLGIPFVISALLIDRLKGAFGFIKRNYCVINKACGIFLIAVGIAICLGFTNKLLNFLS